MLLCVARPAIPLEWNVSGFSRSHYEFRDDFFGAGFVKLDIQLVAFDPDYLAIAELLVEDPVAFGESRYGVKINH